MEQREIDVKNSGGSLGENRRQRPEVLAPASSLEVLKTAIFYGADAVYIGGEMYGLRAKAKNFSMDDMREGIAFAHARGKNVIRVAVLSHNGVAYHRCLGSKCFTLKTATRSLCGSCLANSHQCQNEK